MADADIILATLDEVTGRVGDPTPQVYERLFAEHPDLEPLFFMDSDGGVRGSMLQQCFECIIDAVGDKTLAKTILTSECDRHQGYDVPADTFWMFFTTIRDTFRDLLGTEWSASMEREWEGLLSELRATGTPERATQAA